jgi:hypothetical protein
MSAPLDRREPPARERAPADPRQAPRTRRGMHDALGYQLRQVSKEIRRLQREAQSMTTRPDKAETHEKVRSDEPATRNR